MREGGEERGVTTVACALVERYVGAWQAGALFVLLVLVLVLVLSRFGAVATTSPPPGHLP